MISINSVKYFYFSKIKKKKKKEKEKEKEKPCYDWGVKVMLYVDQ